MATFGGNNSVQDGLVFHYDTGNKLKSYRGEPTVNLYGDMSTSSNLRGGMVEFNTNHWTAPIPAPPENIGVVYEHRNGAFSGTSASYSSAYMLKDFTVPNDVEYTLTSWLYVTPDCNIERVSISIERGSYTDSSNGAYDLSTDKGRWVKCYVTSKSSINSLRAIPIYPRKDNPTPGEYFDGSFKGAFYWGGAQFEQKPHPTPFTPDTRLSTESLLDLTGNTAIDLSTVSFDEDGIFFDGDSNTMSIGTFSHLTQDISFEVVVQLSPTRYNNYQRIFGSSSSCGITVWNNNTINWNIKGTTSGSFKNIFSQTHLQLGGFYHIIGTFQKNTLKAQLFINGVLENIRYVENDFGSMVISSMKVSFNGSQEFSGKIPIAKIYNKALTPQEVQQNFNAIKGRFGITSN